MAVIPPVLSCSFTISTGLFIQKNIQNMIETNPKPLNKHNNHPNKHFEWFGVFYMACILLRIAKKSRIQWEWSS